MFRSKKSKNKFSTAAIIGSGISGIACAIRLSQLGFKVEVFEGNKHAGGKISEIEKDGFRFDSGPSLLTLPQLIDELFYCCNKNPREYFNYNKLEIICKYFYNDGATLKAFSSPVKFADEAERVTGEPSKKILRYLKKSKKLFDVVEPVFLQRSLHKRSTYFVKPAWNAFINLYKLDSGSTLHNRNKTEFSSPKIVQLFDRYATYNGSDPFLAPATLKVIPHLEFNLGAYFPVNGMRSIITSLQELAEQSGVTFYFNSVVEEIIVSNNSATGIKFRNSEGASIEKFDVVVSNMDVVNTYRKLLPEKNNINQIEKQPRSTSALVFYWGIKKEFSELELHNILFSSDYKREFEFLTHKKEIYNDPTIYINISSKKKKMMRLPVARIGL
ncbi:MAG: NAD(P)/FAD-dependent oxidoreductase [Chitinophagales bacterium]|nr:NAD(P)/FAD-dependent oxidoreductase [Chitinophagales bacterium]